MRFPLKAWAFLWAIIMCATIVPVMDRVAVLLTYGWSGYSDGIRVLWQKPLRFTNGEIVSPNNYKVAGAVSFFGYMAIVVAPALGVPAGLRRSGRETAKPSGT